MERGNPDRAEIFRARRVDLPRVEAGSAQCQCKVATEVESRSTVRNTRGMAEQKMDEMPLATDQLILDPLNPRLPEELQGGSQPEILIYLFENAVLDELARSFINNGFFQHEPLIVTPEAGKFVALEGNRRLAAIKVLLQDGDAEEAELSFEFEDELTDETRRGLLELPTWVVESRRAVQKYLGFRHIGGIKTWSSEAKARYLTAEVDLVEADEEETGDPFRTVARRVGSNVQGVRNAYIAFATLRHARDEFGLNVAPILHRRFGVWTRCMNAPDIRSFIGLGDPRTYEEVRDQLRDLDRAPTREVLADLVPQRGRRKALLADSRDVTVYAQALHNDQAYIALREYQDFELARQIVEEAGLIERVSATRQALELMITEVTHARQLDPALKTEIDELINVANALSAIVSSKV